MANTAGLFDVFPYMHEQIKIALRPPPRVEGKGPCRLLSSLLDSQEWRRGAIVVGGATTVAADQARQFDVAVTSRARRTVGPSSSECGASSLRRRRGYGSLHFNRERDGALGRSPSDGSRRDQLLDRIGYGSYGPNKTEN